jgi:hypothetical protein
MIASRARAQLLPRARAAGGRAAARATGTGGAAGLKAALFVAREVGVSKRFSRAKLGRARGWRLDR